MKINHIYQGNAIQVSSQLEDSSIQSIITSPPYYRQRNYSEEENENEIGRENSIQDYLDNLVETFNRLRPKLKDNGLLWVNLGDKYIDKELQGIPWKFALLMKDNGWKLRSDVIWMKPNAMPSSVKNRPTTDHEYVFMFAKTNEYFYNADAIREEHVTFSENFKMKGGRNHFGKRGGTPEGGKNQGDTNLHDARWDQAFHPLGRNKRTVWNIPVSRFKGAHFAVFPPKLVETCLLASTEEEDIVLDPFMGSGTTGVVALLNNRKYIGIDLYPEYVELTEKRIKEECQQIRLL